MRSDLALRSTLLATVAIAASLGVARTESELHTVRDLHATPYRGAATCTRCHEEHARSFGRTFHRTMTQVANRTSVKAPFGGETVSYFGVAATMERDQAGAFVMRYGGGDVPERRMTLALTVGSRRTQQYVARAGDSLVRLPWAYDVGEQRWFHMNAAFLTPDPAAGPRGIAGADYERHVTRWNDNCIFCHNVHPQPGLIRHAAGEPHFASEVAEHGVSCEACHGPAAEHVQRNQNPYRRYRLHLSDSGDPTIVNPGRLSQARSLDVCGRCHGQRITDDVAQFLRLGDSFVPGDDLALYSAPLWRDTALHGEVGTFAPRFWADGTPRLTAYEYQGVLLSPCAIAGPMTCLDCHSMHQGDPRGQLRPDRPGDALCSQCHERFAPPENATAHARHAESSNVRCIDCHMPSVVFGVQTSHPSHRIELPDPAEHTRLGRPDACTLCHVNESAAWAAAEREKLWGPERKEPASEAPPQALSHAEAALFGGDPVTRALTAAAFGQSPFSQSSLPRATALLLEVLAHDPYPGVRHVAFRALRALHGARVPEGAYVPTWEAPQRLAAVAAFRAHLSISTLPDDAIDRARIQASHENLEIGE